MSTASSFELVEEQQIAEADVAMAAQEAQEMRDREAAVAAGLVLTEPSTPPEGTAADVVDGLSKALELLLMLDRPESDKGASGPVDEGDVDMGEEVPSDKAPPAKKMRGFVAASTIRHLVENQLVTLKPAANKAGYFKVGDLPDAFPFLPASAAALLWDITVLEMGSLFHKFVGNTEDLVLRILEAYVPMKIQLRQEEVWRSQFQQNKVGIGAQRMRRLDGQSDYDCMCKLCGTGWPEAAKQCWVCPGVESVPYQAPSATYESEGIIYHLRILDGKPAWFQQQDGESQGASGPGGSHKAADRKLADGSNLGRPKTDSMDESLDNK